jgi:hypothetical protein
MLPIQISPSKDASILVPILHEAEEGDEHILAAIEDASNAAYLAQNADEAVGTR